VVSREFDLSPQAQPGMVQEKIRTIVIIAVLGLAALGALALGASTQQQTCPPDVEVKWYARL